MQTIAHKQDTRESLQQWQAEIQQNVYQSDSDLRHSIHYYFPNDITRIDRELNHFGMLVPKQLEALVTENNLAQNLPRVEFYNGYGERTDKVIHHPSYIQAGDIIYRTRLMEKMAAPGGLLEALSLFFLSAQAGEAGHNCPIACSAGILRVFYKVADFPQKKFYWKKLITPSFHDNFTGAQFLTEIQGGSDVGLNTVHAEKITDQQWKISGEKWFCSNANAELFFITARYDETISGTKGLGLFLIPATLEDGTKNHFHIRRLKEKLGTRSMATAEIDFAGALAIPMGNVADGFKLVMENVLHTSRMFNAFCVTGMARRAYSIARSYAKHRIAFGQDIINYPLVAQKLALVKAENSAVLAAILATARLQDNFDAGKIIGEEKKLLLRLLVNLNKYLSALWSVQHIHHALDTLAGNGTIETFSSIPRLLRDCLICENWEGTHNVLAMQILRDIHKLNVDTIYMQHVLEGLQNITDKKCFALLKDTLDGLEKNLKKLRGLGENVQALQIHDIVHEMALLFCGLNLALETQDQIATQKVTSKLDCLELFFLTHLVKQPPEYNQAYLDLLSKIVK